ncbi:hypothetical protein OP10G_4535 [Fimbriimonas ginsengisoli Gsoil 348]|uniref:Uncharacterized protein n=1 Tax=Fimbriimonas ginsengisoli Gsoil 348 TaxID=661478 RepID=A0A068NWK4_FIMGI|nr:hypothetical protein OP10G_4535 [Fimbriimonas ginsengisoli Gsoil 348]
MDRLHFFWSKFTGPWHGLPAHVYHHHPGRVNVASAPSR